MNGLTGLGAVYILQQKATSQAKRAKAAAAA